MTFNPISDVRRDALIKDLHVAPFMKGSGCDAKVATGLSVNTIADIFKWLKGTEVGFTLLEHEKNIMISHLPKKTHQRDPDFAVLPTDVVMTAETAPQSLFYFIREYLEVSTATEFGSVDPWSLTLEATVFEDLIPVDLAVRVQQGRDMAGKAEAIFSHVSHTDVVRFRAFTRRMQSSLQVVEAPLPTNILEFLPFEDSEDNERPKHGDEVAAGTDGDDDDLDIALAPMLVDLCSGYAEQRQEAACALAQFATSCPLRFLPYLAEALAGLSVSLQPLMRAAMTRYPMRLTMACISTCPDIDWSVSKILLAHLPGCLRRGPGGPYPAMQGLK